MLESAIVWTGIVIALAGVLFTVKPSRRLYVPTRRRGLLMIVLGLAMVATGMALPAAEQHVTRAETRLDAFAPAWQFHERHSRRIAASPERVFDAIKRVRADEIFLFGTLIAIRTGFSTPPESIRAATERGDSLLDVATSTTFVTLADATPRELVIGTVVGFPPGVRVRAQPEMFATPLPPGFTLATMNFLVTPDDAGGSVVSTETRVFANSADARQRFARYWRVIYPGSALIRLTYLRAIERRATAPAPVD